MPFTLPYRLLNKFMVAISVIGVIAALIDSGFTLSVWLQQFFHIFYLVIVGLGFFAMVGRYLGKGSRLTVNKVVIFDLLTSAAVFILLMVHFFELAQFGLAMPVDNYTAIKVAVFVTFIREISDNNFSLNRAFLNPGQFFILSFLFVVGVGSLLLMMPHATTEPISYVDALFTATSAVCVTGLVVVDTATRFTTFGQLIIIGLIQVGGLGILTFVTYFSYFFKGGVSYETRLSLTEINFSPRVGDMITTIKSILYVTFGVEALAAVLIYLSIYDLSGMSVSQRIYFSVFHAISAFCNAGFSTFSAGLYDESLRFNYPLQLIISTTFLFGGMGFIIVVNLLRYLRHRVQRLLFQNDPRYGNLPWLLSLNSRITLITSGALLLIGLIGVMIFEYHGILAEHQSFFGKVITGLFTAATPRTAGFNIADMDQLALSTVMLTIFLMWVGASPNSTGGGIKTSTFAIALLNTLSLARGQSKVEVFQREIADISIRRAFSIMWLSIAVIAFGVTFISINQPQLELLKIIFECVSAYSTVGLSLNLTPELSDSNKIIVAVIMFVGRVGMLTIFVAILKNRYQRNYHYPTEEITIN